MADRKVVFLVPCNAINMSVIGFFQRANLYHEIACEEFEFEPSRDINKIATGRDHGVWKQAHHYLQPLVNVYEKAVILVDAQFPGSPGADSVKSDIEGNMLSVGWGADDFIVYVFDPELEALMWQEDNALLSEIIKFNAHDDGINQWLKDEGWISGTEVTPAQPKEALENALKLNRTGKNIHLSVVCKKYANQTNFDNCSHAEFTSLIQQFQQWFPVVAS